MLDDDDTFPESRVNEINKKYKEEEKNKEILINDFSYHRNEIPEYNIHMSPTEYPEYSAVDVKIATLDLDRSNYIRRQIIQRIADLYETIDLVSKADSELIDIPLSKEELDVFRRNDEDIPEIEKEFESINDNIKTLENGINNIQEKLNKVDEDKERQNYIKLQNKQIDVMRYIKNLNFNIYDEYKDK